MTDTTPTEQPASASQSVFQTYDRQATGLLDATFAETLGLSMHNAVNSQLNAQMSAATSITSACNRILQSGAPARAVTPEPSLTAEPATPAASPSQALTAPNPPPSPSANTEPEAELKDPLWNRLRHAGPATTDR